MTSNMKPVNAGDNVGYMLAPDGEVFGNGFVTFFSPRSSAYFKHLLLCQFGHWTFFASVVRAMSQLVLKIASPCVVSQVRKLIVRWVAIVMAAVHPFWPWTDKSSKNQKMHISRLPLSILIKVNNPSIDSIATTPKKLAFLWLVWAAIGKSCHAVYAAHIAKIRDLVKPLKIGDWFPNFIHAVTPSSAPKVVHGSQWSDWFSGATLAMNHHSKG